jgi:predicted metal-dependent phosphoesterase TrpH
VTRGWIIVALLSAYIGGSAHAQPAAGMQWFKGNTHTHTTESDGDSPPAVVAQWYKDNGYDFLVISDHNKLTDVSGLQKDLDEQTSGPKAKRLLLVPGEEVSDAFGEKPNRKPIHLNALGTTQTVGVQGGNSLREVIQNCINAIREKGGLVHINHPNFGWAITADDMFAVEGCDIFEIYNGHPAVNNVGGGGAPSTEEMWDDLLTRGKRTYVVATDDAHNLKKWSRTLSNPGRGWVYVRADSLEQRAIIDALAAGQFYASTGVTLDDVATTGGQLALRIKGDPFGQERYRTDFVAEGGKVVKTDTSLEPSCPLGEHKYIRARVTSSNGWHAWTQPVFAGDDAPSRYATAARH